MSGISNPHHIGVSYSASSGRWSIYNEDVAAMPVGAAFNVWVPTSNPLISVFVHTATEGATSTHLAHPGLDGCGRALFTVTHNRTPGGVPGPSYDHAPVIQYDPSGARWRLGTQSADTIPLGTAFNVAGSFCDTTAPTRSVEMLFLHATTASNTTGALTRLEADVRFGDLLFVTHDAAISPFKVNPRAIGVLYDPLTDRMAVFNENDDALPVDTLFHVLVAPKAIFSDGFESGATDAWSGAVP